MIQEVRSDGEDVISDTEEMFEPAGEIEVKEEIDSNYELKVLLSPSEKVILIIALTVKFCS